MRSATSDEGQLYRISTCVRQIGLNGDVRANCPDRIFDLGGGPVIGFEMRDQSRRFVGFAVHFSRARAVGQGDDLLIGIGRVVQKHGLSADIGQQHARRNHDEIRLAKRQVAVVVERAQRQASGRSCDFHDGACSC